MEHESDGDSRCNWCTRYSQQKIGTGIRNKRTSGDHPKYNMIEIGQNTKKSLGDLRRLAVTQDSSEKPSANAGVKNYQMSKVILI